MANNTNDEALLKLAIEYYVDGKSLDQSLGLAAKKFSEMNKIGISEAINASKHLRAALAAETKKDEVRILKAYTQTEKQKTKIALDEARIRQRELEKEDKADKKGSFTRSFENFGGKIGTISAYGAAISIIGAVTGAIKTAIGTIIEFETKFTDLQVKSGYTNKEMALVSESIIQVGQATSYSTDEIITATTELSKLGFTAEEVAQILPNLASLAAATGESLESTASIMGAVINAYEYTADQTILISDRMVDVFNNTALNLEKFNTAFSYVGAAAAQTGTSFAQLTAAMGVLSDRGVTASKIGTGLRNVFVKLGESGLDLRGILEKISKEHLSFYEVAELVGDRAANQLFIMANSLDEFDKSVADSMEDYGEAAKAAGLQMDTFANKWKTLINIITDSYALPAFDPDERWGKSIEKSIGLLDVFSTKLSDTYRQATIQRIFNSEPSFRDKFVSTKTAIGGTFTSDSSVLEKMKKDILAEMAKSGYNKILFQQLEAIRDLQVIANEGDFSLASKIYDTEEIKSKEAKLKEAFDLTLVKVSDALRKKYGTEQSNSFIDLVIYGKDPKKKLDELKSKGMITQPDFDAIYSGMKYLNDKAKEKYQILDTGSIEDVLTKQYNEEVAALKRINKGSTTYRTDVVGNDKKFIDEAMEQMKKTGEEICEKYPTLAAKLGIVCKKKGGKQTGEYERFNEFEKTKTDYEVQKDRLSKEFGLEEDPVKKSEINAKMIALEKTYREDLNKQYVVYLEARARERAAFAKKYPDSLDSFDRNITEVKDAQIREGGEGQKNLNTYALRDLEAKKKEYEQSFNDRQAYLLKIAALDQKYRSEEYDTPRKRKELLAERNKITQEYYDTQVKQLDKYYQEVEKQIKDTETFNAGQALIGGSQVDLTELKKVLAEAGGNKDKLLAELLNAIKSPKDGDSYNDFDYFGAIQDTITDIYEVYNTMADLRLEALQEQIDLELSLLEERFTREADMRNAALESGIISQEQAVEAEKRANKRKIDEENRVNKKLFEAQKKRDTEEAIFRGLSDTATAVSRAFAQNTPPVAIVLAAISAAAIATASAANLKAISARKFVPQKYAKGGMVYGRPHSQGGVPFSVNGQGGYEMEGGEYIVNKESTRKHLAELERINGKTIKGKAHFATGGQVAGTTNSDEYMSLVVEALNKPVRAYVTNQDLAKANSEREALTKKTSY